MISVILYGFYKYEINRFINQKIFEINIYFYM